MTNLNDYNGTYDGYTVEDGRVVSPGKFEGEMVYMIPAYQQYLEGFCDDDGSVITVDMPAEFRNFPELRKQRTVKFTVSDQGFVTEVR